MSKNRAKIKSLTMLLIGRTVETEKGGGRPPCFLVVAPIRMAAEKEHPAHSDHPEHLIVPRENTRHLETTQKWWGYQGEVNKRCLR